DSTPGSGGGPRPVRPVWRGAGDRPPLAPSWRSRGGFVRSTPRFRIPDLALPLLESAFHRSSRRVRAAGTTRRGESDRGVYSRGQSDACQMRIDHAPSIGGRTVRLAGEDRPGTVAAWRPLLDRGVPRR